MSQKPNFSDDQLLQGIAAKDPAVLEALIKDYHPVICRFAEKFLPDSSLAKDIAQESFIKLWRSDASFDTMTALKAYLYTIAHNGCLDMLRNRVRLDARHQRAAVGNEENEPAFAEIVQAEAVALIFQYVRTMPEKMQKVFFLSYREGMTVSEIAAHLGWKVQAVKKQKYKALVALRSRFGGQNRILLTALVAFSKYL
ncbi:MAG: sigma-70 family RNA polymerase sigma factor [Bacteroidetes bacterium]|nr:sigma-70 family RNA polymerase sigma factor [Bacteroidota bacterium]